MTTIMLLKIMGAEDAPDDDSRKTFALHSNVASAEFERRGDACMIHVTFGAGGKENWVETFDCPGNAYLMNDQGKTVATFGSASLDPKHEHQHRPVARDHSAEVARA